MISFTKHVGKFCLDIEREKKDYERLMNDPDAEITKTTLINGQGKDPSIFVVVYWLEDDFALE